MPLSVDRSRLSTMLPICFYTSCAAAVRSHGGLGADARRFASHHLCHRLLGPLYKVFSHEQRSPRCLPWPHFFSRAPIEGNRRGRAAAVSVLLLFRVSEDTGAEIDQRLFCS